MAAGGVQSAAIDCEGQLYVWGTGSFGMFLAPFLISHKHSVNDLEHVEVGNGFGIAKARNGALFVWGSNHQGELGLGDFDTRS